MTYEQAKNITFACATRPEGYNGQIVAVEFAFDYETGKTLEVHSSGYHTSCVPKAADTSEALWLIENHPTSKRLYSNVIITDWTQVRYN